MFYPFLMTKGINHHRRVSGIVLGAIILAVIPYQPRPALGEATGSSRFEIVVLGVAQDGGVPHLGCDKMCCTAFRARGQRLFPASLGVHDRETGKLLLVEATPAIEDQIALLQGLTGTKGRGRKPVDGILLTHAHIGHYLGLAQLSSAPTPDTAGAPVAPAGGPPLFAHTNAEPPTRTTTGITKRRFRMKTQPPLLALNPYE